MEDLFNQLKSQPSVNRYVNDFPPSLQQGTASGRTDVHKRRVQTSPNQHEERRHHTDLLAKSAATVMVVKKRRSLTPPKAMQTRPLKVRISRKNVLNFISQNRKGHAAIKQKTRAIIHSAPIAETKDFTAMMDNINGSSRNSKKIVALLEAGEKATSTPTKAQQKQFEPAVLKKAHQLNKYRLKRCMVRLPRKNLEKLQQLCKKRNGETPKSIARKSKSSTPPMTMLPPKTSSARRGRSVKLKESEKPSGFFINAAALTNKPLASPIEKQTVNRKGTKAKTAIVTEKKSRVQKRKGPRSLPIAQLVKAFGARTFRSFVRMERCHHPLMLIFESNARARDKRTSQSKAKKLSVSFNEVVELFGNDDDDDDEHDNDDLNFEPSTSQAALNRTNVTMPVMPTRLKKVENGKVVEDIELDQSILVHPANVVSSTPFPTDPRKKHKKKSFSKLKGDGTPSPGKERLKEANEKLPSGLRRLRLYDDDDDDDDDCEYIVPIDIPKKSSQSSTHSETSCLTSTTSPSAATVHKPLTDDKQPPNDKPSIIDQQQPANNKPAMINKQPANEKQPTDDKQLTDDNQPTNDKQPTEYKQLEDDKQPADDQQLVDDQQPHTITLQQNTINSPDSSFASAEEKPESADEPMKESTESKEEIVQNAVCDLLESIVDEEYNDADEDDVLRNTNHHEQIIDLQTEELDDNNFRDDSFNSLSDKDEENHEQHYENVNDNDTLHQHIKEYTHAELDHDLSDISDNDNLGDDVDDDDLNERSFMGTSSPIFDKSEIPLDTLLSKNSNETGIEADHLLNLNDFNTNINIENTKELDSKMVDVDDDTTLQLFVEDSDQISSNFIDGVDHIVHELSKNIEIEENNTKATIGINSIDTLTLEEE